MRASLKKLKTVVGRVWRDVGRQLEKMPGTLHDKAADLLAKTKRLLTQKQKDKNKLYSLHAPEAECIAKGKARQPYEFGVKVSIATTHKEGLVVGMRSMPGNPYDGHTLFETLEQVAILTDCQPKEVFVDLGYRGADVQPGTKVYHHKLKRDITQRLRRDVRRRSAIEPAIGHMKNDGRLRRNWLKGSDGDAFHALLCGCGHNLRMILRKLRLLFALIVAQLLLPMTSAALDRGRRCQPAADF
jgi:IS5 family transposase